MPAETTSGGESRERQLTDLLAKIRSSIPELAGEPPADPTAAFARAVAEHFLDDATQALTSAAANNTQATVPLYYDGRSTTAMLARTGSVQEQEAAESLLGNAQHAVVVECGGYPPGPLTYAQARAMYFRHPTERPLRKVSVDPTTDPHLQSLATQLTIKHPDIPGLSLIYTYQGPLPPDSQPGLPLLQLEPLPPDPAP